MSISSRTILCEETIGREREELIFLILTVTGDSLLFSSPPIERRSARQRITKNSRCQALLRLQVILALTFLQC